MPAVALKKTDYLSDEIASSIDDSETTVGSILTSARQERRENLDKVSKTLRISEVYLQALEADDRARMPEMVYTIGFLRTYSLYLGLNAEAMVNKFKEQFNQAIKAETLMFPVPAPERSIPSSTLVMLASGLGLLIVMAWLYLRPTSEVIDEFQHLSPVVTQETDADLIAPVEEEAPVQETQSPEVIHDSQEFTQPQPIFPVHDMRPYDETRALKIRVQDNGIYLDECKSFTIHAKEDAWVEVRNNKGEILLSKTLKAGESEELQASPNMKFSTGNAGGVTFFVNGRYYSGLGKDAEVMKGKTLHFTPTPIEG